MTYTHLAEQHAPEHLTVSVLSPTVNMTSGVTQPNNTIPTEEENKLATSYGAQGQRRVVREKQLKGWSSLLLATYRARKGAGQTGEEIEYAHMHKLACANMQISTPWNYLYNGRIIFQWTLDVFSL